MREMENQQYIEFGSGGDKYAIAIGDIHEIIRIQEVTETPNCPPYVKGVINLRGKIVPVISLRSLFQLPEAAHARSHRIIVVNHKEEIVGVVVDEVDRVTTYSDIQPPPDRIGSIEGHFFEAIGIRQDQLVGILKLDQVLLK